MKIIHISFFLSIFIFYFLNVSAVPTRHLCRQDQRDALLEFKNGFQIRKHYVSYCYFTNESSVVIPYPKTESWKNKSDCCYWDGIKCDAKTGEVVELDLSCSCLHGRFHSNTSLFRLQNLDLSFNDLYGQIPSSIGKLSQLTSLDLSGNKFSGQIPSSIGNISHLTSLKFTGNQLSGQIPSSIGNLSHLTFLDFRVNEFSGQIPSSIGKLSRLTFLQFSRNNLDGEIPFSFGSLNQLTNLDVSANKLSGKFPIALLNLTKLSDLWLSYNQFTGTLPPNISSLSNLEFFMANVNAFVGTIPSSLFTIPSLICIALSNNQLNGTLEFGKFSSPSKLRLRELSLGNNNLRGPIPRSISKLVNLEVLDLSHLNTQGPVDFSILSNLKLLQLLHLSHLNTTTTIDLNSISSFSKSMESLDLSGNHVLATHKISVSDPPSQNLSDLYLSSCSITEFPGLLITQMHMKTLDISNNKIKGQVPGWLWTLPNLFYVDFSNNTFISFQVLEYDV